MSEFTKRALLKRRGPGRGPDLTQLAASVVNSPDARRDLVRLVVTVAVAAVTIAALAATVLIVRPELITAFASFAVSR